MTVARALAWAVAVGLVISAVVGPAVAGSAELPAELRIGTVKIVEGTATVRRADQLLAAREGLALAEGDVLQTGADGRLGVILRDDTRLSLGPDTEIRLDRFAFAPLRGSLALVVWMARGVAAYVSGRIARLAPDAVRIETPVAIVGVRGTHFAARVEIE